MDERPQLSVEVVKADADIAVVEVGGELDIFTCPELGRCLDKVIENGAAQVVVDLAAVDFIDSSALGVLTGMGRRLAARGATLMLLCRANSVDRVLKIIGIDHIFAIHTLD